MAKEMERNKKNNETEEGKKINDSRKERTRKNGRR